MRRKSSEVKSGPLLNFLWTLVLDLGSIAACTGGPGPGVQLWSRPSNALFALFVLPQY